jgi:hypothetical protein
MVEFEIDDYNEIINWFTIAYGKWDYENKTLPRKAKKTYWKLAFLAEDKIKEETEEQED